MKLRAPLLLQVSLWLLFNLGVLAALGGWFLLREGSPGWRLLIAEPAQQRLAAMADVLEDQLPGSSAEQRATLIASLAAANEVDLQLFHNDEGLIAGPNRAVPADVARLVNGRRPPEPRPQGPPPPPAPREGALPGPPPKRSPGPGAGAGPQKLTGAFFIRSAQSPGYWVGVRLRLPHGDPGTLLAYGANLAGNRFFFDPAPIFQLLGIGAAVSLLIWLPFVVRITRALKTLERATGEMARGRFDTPVNVHRADELGALAASVRQMATQLDQLLNGQRRFLSDVAHELCSPLARLQMASGILEDRAAPADRERVADVREEVQQMAELVNELLAFSQASLGSAALNLQPVDLAAIVRGAIQKEGVAEQALFADSSPAWVQGDARLLERAVGNVLRNALRYAGDGCTITITLGENRDHTALIIADNGPGVAPELLPRLAEPFYRPDISRESSTGGVGLGLAIVKSAVEACGGTLHFAPATRTGLAVTLRFVRTSVATQS